VYIFDTNVFYALGHYYPSRFPTIWERIDSLAEEGELLSVKEVKRELEGNCPAEFVEEWVKKYRKIFHSPSGEEMTIVAEMFKKEQYRGFVKRQNILKGLPVADPFIVAAAKVLGAHVVTQESSKPGGARIPTVCHDLRVKCLDLEKFLEYEKLRY
jgi:hypothetical protein